MAQRFTQVTLGVTNKYPFHSYRGLFAVTWWLAGSHRRLPGQVSMEKILLWFRDEI